ncbi:hypothetical protein GGD65_001223 [Bradyrhizobium sp. CIR18]|uniref:hypothetical protein n=1 Tax=Bradyrhizobium sp. CIR18 TaxID=2663839 RepID=UPI001606239A|nr:hypothetical protein [Bradyrhizobium sp. CIR18]MBB4263349.1 hypothetical protein [Bradyrhizobium sp. CIR3A]MBB4360225.1 hypothetical protein [Bradyrhizobium sp. CIR18]NYG50145.1 hypothetical protein [Bradyrhizobium sp. IAR9]
MLHPCVCDGHDQLSKVISADKLNSPRAGQLLGRPIVTARLRKTAARTISLKQIAEQDRTVGPAVPEA